MDVKENEIEKFYIDPIKEKAYKLASHISPSGVIDKDIANIALDEMTKFVLGNI